MKTSTSTMKVGRPADAVMQVKAVWFGEEVQRYRRKGCDIISLDSEIRINIRADAVVQQSTSEEEEATEEQTSRSESEPKDPKTVSMSSASSREMMAACMVAMMMMMMMAMTAEAAAMPKGGGQSKHLVPPHRKSETVSLQLDHSALVPAKNIRALENASISPWTYNVSQDNSLFPSMLAEARCLLQGCLDSEGLEDLSLESRPIMRQVMLLRRVRSAAGAESGHGYHYRLEYRVIAVGCTCVRPVVQHQE